MKALLIIYRKPLIVTCSKDHTIRVWNYLTKGMELAKKFREELFRLTQAQLYIYINCILHNNISPSAVVHKKIP